MLQDMQTFLTYLLRILNITEESNKLADAA